jgi:hypothetical protein
MKSSLIPFKWGVVILSIFQVYTIYKNWNEGFNKSLLSIFILIGCIFLIIFDIIFSKKDT